MEPGALRAKDVVVPDIAESLFLLGNQEALLKDIVRSFHLIVIVREVILQALFSPAVVAVEADRVLALDDEVDLGHVHFLLVDVPLFGGRFELSRHKSERDLIQEVAIKVDTCAEKRLEG